MWGQPPNPFGMVPPVDPTFGLPPLRMPTPPVAPMAAAVQAKPKFFGEGGTGRTIIGIIADALAGAAGGQGTYAPLMMQKHQLQLRREEELRKANAPIRTEINGDYVEIDPTSGGSKVLYHSPPKAPSDEFSRSLDLAGIPLEERPGYYRKKVDNEVAPKVDWQMVTDAATGAKSLIPVPRGGPSSAEPPPGAVEFLKAHPDQASAFEQKYGPGSASRYLGGPTPRASGTFR